MPHRDPPFARLAGPAPRNSCRHPYRERVPAERETARRGPSSLPSRQAMRNGSAKPMVDFPYVASASGTRAGRRPRTKPSHVSGLAERRRAFFISPSVGRLLSASKPPYQKDDTMRRRANHARSAHCGLRSGNLRTNRPLSCDGAVIGRALNLLDSCGRSASRPLELLPLNWLHLAGNGALDQPCCCSSRAVERGVEML
jgi:hypothetical protein